MDLTSMIPGGAGEEQASEQRLSKEEYAAMKKQQREEVWLKKIVAERKAAEAKWRKANPEKAAQMDEWFSGKAPKVDWSKVEHCPRCHKAIEREYTNHCSSCGQKLLWQDIDNIKITYK